MLSCPGYAAGPATSSGTRTTRTRLFCHFGTPHTPVLRPVFALSRAKSNYSRTSTKCARKSNHSRTYAKTGGWGVLTIMVTYLQYVGAPTFLFLREAKMLHVQQRCGGTETERSLDPGEAHGAHKSRCATRRARIRRGRENRVAPLPSTALRAGRMTNQREGKKNSRTGPAERDRPLLSRPSRGPDHRAYPVPQLQCRRCGRRRKGGPSRTIRGMARPGRWLRRRPD